MSSWGKYFQSYIKFMMENIENGIHDVVLNFLVANNNLEAQAFINSIQEFVDTKQNLVISINSKPLS